MSDDSNKEQMKTDNLDNKNKKSYIIQEKEKEIKFYLIDDDIYYIFIKNKNEIKIISSLELFSSFTLYHHDIIQDFIITSKTNSLILCSLKDISLYILSTSNKKINYNLSKIISIDNTLHLSSSILEDIIISLNSHFVINIFDMKLKNIKSFNIDKSYISNDNYLILPLDVFMLNYDTKTILLSKYGYNQFGLIYKHINNENFVDYKIKNILINEKIICIKEYEKNLDIYFHYKDNSVLLILTEELNFLIVQKVFEENFQKNKNFDLGLEDNYNYEPNIKTLLYIDLSNYCRYKDYRYLSFSFFLANEKTYNNGYDESFDKKLKSEIIDIDSYNYKNYEDNNDYLNYKNNIKDVNYDYLMFIFSEKICIYKIEGLKLSKYNNPSLIEDYSISVDGSYKNTYTLLNTIKSIDNNYSLFFIDKYNIIKKYNLKIVKQIPNNSDNNNNDINPINSIQKKNMSSDLSKNNNHNHIKSNLELNANNQHSPYNLGKKTSKKFIVINNKANGNKKNTEQKSANTINANSSKIIESPKALFTQTQFDKEKKYEVKKNIYIEYSLMFPLYKNIIYSEYNNFNQLTLIYSKIDLNSVIYLLDNDFSLEKIIIFENIELFKVIWIKNTNFIIFYFIKQISNKDISIIVIFNVFSKYLNKKENFVNETKLKNLFIYVNMNIYFKLNITINNIYIESNLESIKIENSNYNNNDKNKNIINVDNKDNSNYIIKKDSKNPINIPQSNALENSFSFYALLKSEFSLYNLIIKITKANKTKEYDYELKTIFAIKIKSLLLTKYDMINLQKKEFIFNSNEIFYTSYNEQYDFISIIKLNKNLVNKKIFESILLDKLSNIYFYNNNFIIYINKIYINIYDIKNRSFYRILNEFSVNGSEKILFFSYNIHLYLVILSVKYIQLINLISSYENVNKSIIKYEFKYKFLFGEFNMINLINNSLFINNSQIIYNLNDVIITNNCNYIQLIKILSNNSCSIFDKRTFLNNYLNEDENINKVIFNILYNLYQKSKSDKTINYAFKNIKTLPNIFENIDVIKKIISEGIYNYDNNLKNIKFNKDDNPSKIAQFQNFFNKIKDLSFVNYLYDLISNEKTQKYDNLSKYFILKYKSKINNNNYNFKLSTSDLCLLSLINNQTDILNFIFQNNTSNITWDTITKYNIPLWIKNDLKLKELLLEVAKNKYKEDLVNIYKNNTNKTELNNFTENIALYLYLSGNNTILYNYYDKEPHNEKIKKFIMRDFSIKKNQKAAHENADTLLSKKKYSYAAFFYLLANDIRSALDMTYEKMKDINLTVCILKLMKDKGKDNDYTKYYSLNKIYSELFINFGILFRDPYLVTFGYIGQEKYDLALEYILEYNYEYNLNKIKEIISNIDEFVSHLDLLKKTFYFSVFDYKMILFAKKLEKIYKIKFEENSKTIKNLVNTDFNEDEWDMDALNNKDEDDADESKNSEQTNNGNNIMQDNHKLKKININYNNLALLCLKNCSIIGNIFTSNINIFSKLNSKGLKNMPLFLKNNIKNAIISRIILDTMYIISLFNIGKINKTYSSELNIFLEYLLQQSIINNKNEVYYKITDIFLSFNLYKSLNVLPINIYTIKQKNKIFKSIQKYFDSLLNNIIWSILPFNKHQLTRLINIEDLLYKYNNIFVYLVRIIKENKTEENIFGKIYLLRIIICNAFFLMFVFKGFQKYNKISYLFDMISKLNDEYNDLTQMKNGEIINLIETLNKDIIKLIKRIKEFKNKEKKNLKNGLIFYIYFMNYSMNKQLLYFIQNKNIERISSFIINNNQDINCNNIDNHNFLKEIKQKIETDLNTFDFYANKFIKKNLDCNLTYGIYEELKNIYINKNNINFINEDKNNYKIIKVENVFHSKEKNKFFQKYMKFEKIFKLGEIIKNYLPILTIKFKYEKNKDYSSDNKDNQFNIANTLLPSSTISNKSIQIVNNIFGNGCDICYYNNEFKVKDFCVNNCDITQMSISLLEKGNIKINLLENILNKLENRKEKENELNLDSTTNWENAYRVSMHKDYKYLLEFKLIKNNFNNMYPILYQNIVMEKYYQKYNDMISYFPEKINFPPKYFNNIPTKNYLDEIGSHIHRENKKSIYSDILESHPQLPLYLNSNNRGEILLYSFDGNKILDKYYIDKNKSNLNLTMNKLKFNGYGDNFMGCDTEGSLYYWNFDHMQAKKVPYYKITSNNNSDDNYNKNYFFCNDMCYLNNTGVIATINSKSISIFDLLMPEKKCKIDEIFIGGDKILPFLSEKSVIVSNGKSPGDIAFVDLRKMEVIKDAKLYNINYDTNNNVKIMDMKLSENEIYLISYGSDYTVRIWDLSIKFNPTLIESLQPFNDQENNKDFNSEKFKGKIELSSGYLLVSKDNNIKLLRNNII